MGTALALVLVLALVFTSAQVYSLRSASSDVQDVADAAALAAENVVAEYYIAAYVCDAAILSLALTQIAVGSLGVVASIVPGGQGVGKALVDAASKIGKAKGAFADKATQGLENLQRALPLIAQAKAMMVAQANSGGSQSSSYVAAALLVPFSGKPVNKPATKASDEFQEDAQDKRESVERAGNEADEAVRRADDAWQRAYEHDCGLAPGRCMQERASRLAGLEESVNPVFSTSETWSFDVALQRARVYYQARLDGDVAEGDSVEDQAASQMRKRFYRFACEELDRAFVHDGPAGFEARLPIFPKNVDEMRSTVLYSEVAYPRTKQNDKLVLHARDGCPAVAEGEFEGVGSIQAMDGSSEYVRCEQCRFSPSSLGNVAALTTAVDTGFEHHWRIVAEAAAEYSKARSEAQPASSKAQRETASVLEEAAKAIHEAKGSRIEVRPPGRSGVFVLVADVSHVAASGPFDSSFVEDAGQLGIRAAFSSAALACDDSEGSRSVVASLLDGFDDDGFGVVEGGKVVLSVWSGALECYTNGVTSFSHGLKKVLNGLPLAGKSGLGTWAKQRFDDLIEGLELEPAELAAPKAVLVNTGHVLEKSPEPYAEHVLQAKARAIQVGYEDPDLATMVLSQVEQGAAEKIDSYAGKEIEIASVELFDGAVTIPIKIAIPQELTDGTRNVMGQAFDGLKGVVAEMIGARRWERWHVVRSPAR